MELARAGDLQHAVQMVALEVNKRPDTKIDHTSVLAGRMKVMNDDSPGVLAWIESIA